MNLPFLLSKRSRYAAKLTDRIGAQGQHDKALLSGNTQAIKSARERNRAATHAALQFETRVRKFEPLPLPEKGWEYGK